MILETQEDPFKLFCGVQSCTFSENAYEWIKYVLNDNYSYILIQNVLLQIEKRSPRYYMTSILSTGFYSPVDFRK